VATPESNEDEKYVMALSELNKYLIDKRELPSVDPLQWWRSKKERFPNLIILVQKFFSCPLTSAESERLFSTAGFLYNDLRRSMNPTTLQKLLILHHNLPLYNFTYNK
jgi:hypothetical protein